MEALSELARAVKRACTVIEVAAWFGYRYDTSENHPCPKCESESTSRKTLRVYADDRWFCYHCDEGGDQIDWLASRLRVSKGDAIRTLASRLGIDLDAGDFVAVVKSVLFRDRVAELSRDAAGDALARKIVSAARRDRARFFGRTVNAERGSWADRAVGWCLTLRMARSGVEGRARAQAMLNRVEGGDVFPSPSSKKEHLRNAYLATTYRDSLARHPTYLAYARSRGWTSPDLSPFSVGCCTHADSMMAGRVTFPIRDVAGRVAGFGGRIVDPEAAPEKYRKAKYLNSPDRGVFQKHRELYGLDLAYRAVIAAGYAVVVEGYADVLACHVSDVPQAVAPLGSTMSQLAAETLAVLTDRVVLLRDDDAAGRKAVSRWVYALRAVRLTPLAAAMPDGLDPDDVLREHGPESLRYRVTRAVETAPPDVLTRVRAALS